RLGEVFFPIHEHVNEAVSHVARRSQGAGVIAILPDMSSPPRYAVDRARDPYRGSHEPQREGDLVVRLHEQVDVIGLRRQMNDPRARRAAPPGRPSVLVEDEFLTPPG